MKQPERIRLLRMDNETQVMQWDHEKKEWIWQYTLLGDYDIELAPDFDCRYPECMIEKMDIPPKPKPPPSRIIKEDLGFSEGWTKFKMWIQRWK